MYLGLTWSLAVEEQFYLTLPFIVRRVSARTLLGLSVLTIVAAPFARLLANRLISPLSAYTVVRTDALMFGVLAAIVVRRVGSADVFGKHTQALLIAAYALLGAVLLIFTKRGRNHESVQMDTVGYSVLAAFYCCLLLLAISPRDNPLRALLRCNVLIRLGSVAYSVYLLHWTLLCGAYYLMTGAPPHLKQFKDLEPVVVALALTFGIAAVSWRYFEQPLIATGHRFRYKALSIAAHSE